MCAYLTLQHRSSGSPSWSPDGKHLAVAYESSVVVLTAAGLSFEPPALTRESVRFEIDPIYTIAWSPDGKTLAIGGRADRILVYEPAGGTVRHYIEGGFNTVESVDYSTDGRLLAARTIDGSVYLYRTDTWQLVARRANTTPGMWPTSVVFHPTEPILATLTENDRAIQVWRLDIDQRELVRAGGALTDRIDGVVHHVVADLVMAEIRSQYQDIALHLSGCIEHLAVLQRAGVVPAIRGDVVELRALPSIGRGLYATM